MTAILPVIGIGTAVLAGILWISPSSRRAAARLGVAVPAPFLVWAFVADAFTVDAPWVFINSRFGLDVTGRVFLGITSALWLIAGLYAQSYLSNDPRRNRFDFFFYLTMVGNIGLTIAHDILSYIAFYSLMSLAAYGLVVHDGRPFSHWAGKVYIIFTIVGEMLLFAAAVLAVSAAGLIYFDDLRYTIAFAPARDPIVLLFLCGFGIKLGVMPLHSWLPLAHPAAPTPASAVLSGVMIKTGLLGLIRVLPFGLVSLDGIAQAVLVFGILTAFAAAFIGVTQSNAKTVLAYSSISQMGLVATGAGTALLIPGMWPTVLPMLLLFVVHHAVAKAALFLGVGVAEATHGGGWRRYAVTAGLVWAAMSLCGFPFTTGFTAKTALKYVVAETPGSVPEAIYAFHPFTSVATALLMARFLWLIWPSPTPAAQYPRLGITLPWVGLTLGVTVNWLLYSGLDLGDPAWTRLTSKGAWESLWPILAAGALSLCVLNIAVLHRFLSRLQVPAGDIVVSISAIATFVWARSHRPVLSPAVRVVLAARGRTAAQAWTWTAGRFARLSRWVEREDRVGLLVSALVLLLLIAVVH